MKENLIRTYSSFSSQRSFYSNSFSYADDDQVNELYKKLIVDIKLDGKFQKMLFTLFCLTAFLCCLFFTAYPLQKQLPDYYCSYKWESNDMNYKVITDPICVTKFCSVEDYANDRENLIILVNYDSITNYITQLDLFCNSEEYFDSFTQFIFLGKIIGNFVFSYVADKYGRLTSYKVQFYGILICYCIFIFAKSQLLYFIAGFVSSICINIYVLCSVMSTEVMSLPMYSYLNGLLGVSYTICGMTCVAILYFFKSNNILLLLNVIIAAIMFYLVSNYLTETPYFLIDQKNYTQLNQDLIKVSKVNETFHEAKVRYNIAKIEQKIKIDSLKKNDIFKELNNDIGSINSLIKEIFGPYFIAFNQDKVKGDFLKLIIPFITMNFVFYGQVFNVEKLNGNIFFNSIIIYLGEVSADLVSGMLLKTFKRKNLIIICFAICTIICLMLTILYYLDAYPFLQTGFLFINSFFNSMSFTIVYVYSSELFDVNVKSIMISLHINLSNSVLLLSPQILNLFSTPFIPFFLFSGIATFSSFVLEETKHD